MGTKAIAEGLAGDHETVIWSPPPPGPGTREARLNGVEYRFVHGRGDFHAQRLLERLRPLFPARRPPFTSYLHYPSYNFQVALALRREQPDAIRISNFAKLVPLFRRACPSAQIVLSMHCEWLNQLDRRLVSRQLRGADVIVGVSEFNALPDVLNAVTSGEANAAMFSGIIAGYMEAQGNLPSLQVVRSYQPALSRPVVAAPLFWPLSSVRNSSWFIGRENIG